MKKKEVAQRIIKDDLGLLIDKELQEKTWCRNEETYVASFREIIEDFLYDLELLIKYPSEYSINKKSHKLLEELYNLLDEYYSSCPMEDQKIIEDPKWAKVRAFAKDVYKKIQ